MKWMKWILIGMCCMLSVLEAQAQLGDLIDSRNVIKTTSRTSALDKNTIKTLALSITRGKTSDSEKAQAIFDWISTTISYDNDLHHSKQLQKKIYTSETNVVAQVLKRKKALCGGYAFLFDRLCSSVGIDTKVIHGWAKTPGVPFRRTTQPTHTWNMVWLEGAWRYLDITWAVSHATKDGPSSFWYLTPATDFHRTHITKP